ncbi:FAD-dependent monooxygenase (plasmid) [Streptomyces sp. BI20]|uniref:FAD-dependent monooxygenase n=1 Tax=Streptomyces sp. BI20 TaxID=3403460 RepID=UPI003C736314
MNRPTPPPPPGDPRAVDVLIAGAGPTGLMLGALLRRLGVDVVLLEPRTGIDPRTRAVMVHAAALELFDTLGLHEALDARGVRCRRIDFHTPHTERLGGPFRVDFADLAGDTPFPHYLNVPQPAVEELLEAEFTARGGRILRGARLARFESGPHGVDAVAVDAEGAEPRFAARVLIGADGAGSTVRTALGVDFPGTTYPMSYLLAEGLPVLDPDPETSAMYVGPGGAVSLLPLPDGQVRVAGPVSATAALDRETALDPELFRREVDALGHGDALRLARLDRTAHYQVHERLADTFRVGPVLLAGDAAHLNSPAGGQAMNTGFGDAWALAWRLAAMLGGAPDTLLDDYARERRAAAAQVARTTAVLPLLTRMREADTPAARAAVDEALRGHAAAWSRLYPHHEPGREGTGPETVGADLPAPAEHRLRPGARVPGHRPTLGRHTLLHRPGARPPAGEGPELPPGTLAAALTPGQLARLDRHDPEAVAVLVRPDGHVARLVRAARPSTVRTAPAQEAHA